MLGLFFDILILLFFGILLICFVANVFIQQKHYLYVLLLFTKTAYSMAEITKIEPDIEEGDKKDAKDKYIYGYRISYKFAYKGNSYEGDQWIKSDEVYHFKPKTLSEGRYGLKVIFSERNPNFVRLSDGYFFVMGTRVSLLCWCVCVLWEIIPNILF